MSRFRTVGARLSLAVLFVVAVALGTVYLIVVPSLRARLVNARISQLRAAVVPLANGWKRLDPHQYVQDAAASANARVVWLQVLAPAPPPLTLAVEEDSAGGRSSAEVENDRIARSALEEYGLARGTVKRGGDEFAEAAFPIDAQNVLLLSAPLDDALATARFTGRRILIAGALALLVALAIGYGGAWAFARRIRRLERAADRIAGGTFDEPVVDRSTDELGELARAFDRMRVRLAHLDDARREFVANASHELRTPLFSLSGFIELLADEDLDEATRREFLETMAEQVQRLTKLASELLDLTRLDAGRLQVEQRPIELAAVAEALAEEFGAVARANDHPVELDTDGGASALGDEQRVLQIGRILVENALVHTPPATPVRIRVFSENGRAVLAVEDEGGGIPEDQREQLFERFYRLDGTKASGSGLGLAIARELATLMGGTIQLHSDAGTTVFRVLLPTARPEVNSVVTT